jgi:hypothetical protein
MRYTLSILAVFICLYPAWAQSKSKLLPVTFELRYGQKSFEKGHVYQSQGNTLQIQTVRFYISAVALYDGNKLLWEEPESYHLIDADSSKTFQLSLNVPMNIRHNAIGFRLGIDSITNVSGAMGGDLDPSKGMYWSWQSGYINFKVEGTSPICHTRNNEFHFHIGGYSGRDAAAQDVKLNVPEHEAITIITDISRFVDGINLSTQNNIMIPSPEAVILSQKAAKMFSIKK